MVMILFSPKLSLSFYYNDHYIITGLSGDLWVIISTESKSVIQMDPFEGIKYMQFWIYFLVE